MADSVEDLDLTPPQNAQSNAQKVLDWRDEYGDDVKGMTRTGWVRANQLAEGEELSPNIVKRMAQFNRHRKNSGVAEEYRGEPWKDAGHVAWLGWGGDDGIDWALRMSDRIQSIENTGQDTVTTLSHKHINDKKEESGMDEETVENRNMLQGVGGQSRSPSVKEISKNTYNGYFEGKDFDDENWQDAVDRLRELHGTARSFMTNVVRHEDTGHDREENVPVFEDPVDSQTLEEFVSNIEENVDEETYEGVVEDVEKLDEVIRRLFFRVIMHDDFMHDREDFEVSQLLSEEMVKGEDYTTFDGCMSYHVDKEDVDRDQAFAICSEEFDVEENASYSTFEDCVADRMADEDISRAEAEGICMDEVGLERKDEEDFLITRARELDEVSEDDLVTWDGGQGMAYGKVDIVKKDGTVSAEPEGPEMEGSEDEPAVKIEVYDLEDGEWESTDIFVVHRFEALERIDEFPESKENSEKLAEGIIPTHEAIEGYDTTESEDWGRPSYSEFQDSYDFEEQFADLSVEDKRVVSAHFGRVDNSSYEDAVYSDLQLPHHDPETGDVDRSAVIAARQRLPQAEMPGEDLEAIDTHLTDHLKEDFGEDASRITEEENSEDETENSGQELNGGTIVSFDADHGRSYGRVKRQDDVGYTVEVFTAKLGGGWSSAGREKVLSEEELNRESQFPNSLNDVFSNNAGSSAQSEVVEEQEDEDPGSEEAEEGGEKLNPSEVQQIGKKVRSVSEIVSDDDLEDYLQRNNIEYSVQEFRKLVKNF